MTQLAIRSGLAAMAMALVTGGVAQASAPGHSEYHRSTTVSTRTVTETETNAKLTGAGAQTTAVGYVESNVTTVTDTVANTTTTNSSLTITVKRLTLANGSVVDFQLNGTSVGTGVVTNGRASLRLFTKSGAVVPAVATGDTLTVVDPDGVTVDLTGTFGAAISETESGR
ncbi:MAG: hypothetical protein JSS49_23500 [Planctomycetes bacterium]|nr:hypothetical protein [Planctomycetota bacterium]